MASDDPNALLALKNAWNGVIHAAERFKSATDTVGTASETGILSDEDLTRLHTIAMAEANAVMAVRGLLEELRRKRELSAKI